MFGERRVMLPRRLPSAALAMILTEELAAGIYGVELTVARDDDGTPVLLVDDKALATPLIFTRLKPQEENI